MGPQVIYFSRKGSTKKIADAIATELGVPAEDVATATLKQASVIFLGSGCYGGKPGKKITQFIENNDFTNQTVALFGTSGGGTGQESEAMNALLTPKGAIVKGTFCCKGKFWLSNKGKPTDDDITAAKHFAQQMIS